MIILPCLSGLYLAPGYLFYVLFLSLLVALIFRLVRG